MSDKLVYPFRGLLDALKAKDLPLYLELSHLSPSQFWREWKAVYHEDFSQGGLSLPHASSIIPRRMTLAEWDAARAAFRATVSRPSA